MGFESNQIGKRIKQFRIGKKMTQENLGNKVFVSGKHINYIENGKKLPSLELLVLIANALEVSANDLLVDSLSKLEPNENQEVQDFFYECNYEEKTIIIKVARALKKILREHKI